MHRYQCSHTPPPLPIDDRSMEDNYTEEISHIEELTDTSADRPHPPPHFDHRSMEDQDTN